MRILVVGDWHSDLHEEEVFRSLERIGHDAYKYSWHDKFHTNNSRFKYIFKVINKFQNKYLFGHLITKLNSELIKFVDSVRPDVLFIYRGTHITQSTLVAIQKQFSNILIVGYNNDDPFSPSQPRYLWRHFVKCIKYYDLMLAYRKINVKDYYERGAKKVELLCSWYVADRNYPINEIKKNVKFDVVFVGHYENDGRLNSLERIVQAGIDIKIFGPPDEWKKPLAQSEYLRHLVPIKFVWGKEYNQILNSAKIALCFFSKLNRDSYTRRCFEIPATKTLLISQYSEDIANIYKEGHEADFFRNNDELIIKLQLYLGQANLLKTVAQNGYKRAVSSGYDIDSRMRNLVKIFSENLVKKEVELKK